MNNNTLYSIKTLTQRARKTPLSDWPKNIKNRLFNRWTSIGFQRQLSQILPMPTAKIPISVRPLKPKDIQKLFRIHKGAAPDDVAIIRERQEMIDAGLTKCFVAVTDDNIPCYMQWLISSESNQQVRSFFKGRFPKLERNEMLLEGAFVPPAFRGMGIMPAAMAMITEQARKYKADRVITFVEHNNIPSLKGCRRAGFDPYIIRRDESFFNHTLHRRQFIPVETYRLDPPVPLWLMAQREVKSEERSSQKEAALTESSSHSALAH